MDTLEEARIQAITNTLRRRILGHMLARYALRLTPASIGALNEWIDLAVYEAARLQPGGVGNHDEGGERDRPTSPGFRAPIR